MSETSPTIVEPRYRLRVKQRLAIVEYAVAYGVKPASRRFGLNRKTVRGWRDQWRPDASARQLRDAARRFFRSHRRGGSPTLE